MGKRSRVCITGVGAVTPIGASVPEFLAALRAGRSGIRPLRSDFAPRLPHNAFGTVEVIPDRVPKARLAGVDRFSALALVAAHEAVSDAGLAGHAGLADAMVSVGTGIGGAESLQSGYEELLLRNGARVNPFLVIKTMNNAAAAHVAVDFGCHGPSFTFSTACSSSAIAIGEAMRRVRSGDTKIAIAGGTEALLTHGMITAWFALRTLAIPDPADPASACRPFSADRTGLVLGEGSGFVVLEDEEHARARGARIHAVLSGYGARTDATHLTRPDAAGQVATMREALRDAGLAPADIGYLNAHGTATPAGDVVETQAVREAFGTHAAALPVSSTKSMHGHLMGATGAVELIASVLAITHSFLPPTINLHQPDPACDLDYVPNQAREGVAIRHAMSNSFAFGGSNAVLIASRADVGAGPA